MFAGNPKIKYNSDTTVYIERFVLGKYNQNKWKTAVKVRK